MCKINLLDVRKTRKCDPYQKEKAMNRDRLIHRIDCWNEQIEILKQLLYLRKKREKSRELGNIK